MVIPKPMKLVTDSACDVKGESGLNGKFKRVPLAVRIGNQEFKDDESLDVQDLLKAMKKSAEAPKTASPSPGDFLQEFTGEDCVFVVTLSSKLSGSYSNAMLAAELAKEEKPGLFIHVFDSKNASVGETLVSLKVLELIKKKREKTEIVEEVNGYIESLNTYCLLESTDNLVKSGRVSKLVAQLSSVLSLRLILGKTAEGTIELV